jgi:diguanylate cyclase (GGDEF)-like protein
MALARHIAHGLRWFQRNLLVEAVCLAYAGLELWRGARGADGPSMLAGGALGALLLWRLKGLRDRHTPRRAGSPGAAREYRQAALLAVCVLFWLIGHSGGPTSPVYPAVFLVLAAAGGLEPTWPRALLPAAAALALEGLSAGRTWPAGWPLAAGHAAAMLVFPLLGRALVGGLAASLRQEALALRERERLEREREATEFRLSGAVSRSTSRVLAEEARVERRQRASLRHVAVGIGNLLDILVEALRPHTVAFYRLSTDERSLRLLDARSDSERLVREPMPAGEGVLGAILKRVGPVSFDHLRDGHDLLSYYAVREPIRAFLGVPVLEGEHVRGVLLADRRVDVPFGEDDRRLLTATAQEMLRTVQTERLLADMDKVKSETERFYDASKLLNRALGLQEVLDEVLAAVRVILEGVDFAALALAEGDRLVLVGAQGLAEFDGWREKYLQQEIRGQAHLVAQAMRTGTVLPEAPFHQRDREQRLVFGRHMPLPTPLESLKVFPLKVAGGQGRKSRPGEEPVIGALVVAGQRPELFPEDQAKLQDRVSMLQTVANMAAISIQNAQRYQQLERLATTDGLTGLHNHRRFQEMAEELASTALRYGRPLSLALTDIDHFKLVNDTYGHPVGDQVLKRVARVLAEVARATDKVCRYGGEEFAVLLPETDVEGARLLAERFREAIKQQAHQAADGQTFQVTLSLGLCTMPAYARHKQELIDRADQALYHAKRNGRDRAVHHVELGSASEPQGA